MRRPEQGGKQGVKALKERRVGRGDGGAKAARWMYVCWVSEAGQAGRRCGTWGDGKGRYLHHLGPCGPWEGPGI